MHTWGTRANAVVYFAITVLMVALGCNVLSGYLFDKNINSSVQLVKIENFRKDRNNDKAQIIFNVAADLTPLFNWNTREVFIYVVAEYETKSHKKNAVVLWDQIVFYSDKEKTAKFNLTNVVGEYPLSDVGTGLANNKVKLSVHYNTIPITGLLSWTTTTSRNSFSFPSKYTK
eukprot:TRINITY_DN5071_c0_g1_i1.p1 TRINITY_DN5071_c0_g1~~TRINITY_DN5071_c0_g1_i1.p1  ORF type:complete len:173 (+),score=35.06 TRINITY_DN5071_c0_g1_i1:84-602(+)